MGSMDLMIMSMPGIGMYLILETGIFRYLHGLSAMDNKSSKYIISKYQTGSAHSYGMGTGYQSRPYQFLTTDSTIAEEISGPISR